MIDLLLGCRTWVVNIHQTWKMVPLRLMWTIWRERNRHTFEDEKHTGNQLLVIFFLVPYLVGLKAWGFTNRDSIVLFLDTLPFCR